MEVSSPQLAQAVAAARIALAEAFVLKVGQTLQAVVAGKSSDGLTLLKIGEQTVKAALPEGLPPGTTLQLQVKTAGPAPQLVILVQKPPPAGVPVQVAALDTRIAPAAVQAPPSPNPPTAVPQITELLPSIAPAASQTDSTDRDAGRPRSGGPTSGTPAQAASRTPVPSPPAPAPAARAVAPPGSPALQPSRTPPAAQLEVPATPSPAVPADETPAAPTPAPLARLVQASPPSTANGSPPSAPEGPALPTAIPAPVPSTPLPVAAEPKTAVAATTANSSPTVPPADGPEPELLHPLLVAQVALRPAATAAELPRAAVAPNPLPQPAAGPAAPSPATPQAALSQMLPEALARQDSVGPLLQSLATLVQKPAALPEPVLRAALGVLAQRVVATNGKVQPADIERVVTRSGLGLEATLARGEAPASLDAKAGLLTLRAALAKWLGEAPAPVAQQRDAAPPPLKGLPLRAPELEAPPLPEVPREALRSVHGQADAAISRLKLMQMASLPDVDQGRPAPAALRLEMPLLIGHELVMAQLQVSRDGARRETERKRGWTMRFALNYSVTGEVGAEVGLLGKAVNVALWAAEPETAEAMQEALPELGGALEAIGLKPGALRIRHGTPEAEKPASGRLLDSVS